jgi:hypothetical protein
MHARRLGAIAWMLLAACSWQRTELSLPYQPSPLPRVRTRTPVLDDSTTKHLWLGDMVHVVRGCNHPSDSLPKTPVKLPGLCVIETYPQSDP